MPHSRSAVAWQKQAERSRTAGKSAPNDGCVPVRVRADLCERVKKFYSSLLSHESLDLLNGRHVHSHSSALRCASDSLPKDRVQHHKSRVLLGNHARHDGFPSCASNSSPPAGDANDKVCGATPAVGRQEELPIPDSWEDEARLAPFVDIAATLQTVAGCKKKGYSLEDLKTLHAQKSSSKAVGDVSSPGLSEMVDPCCQDVGVARFVSWADAGDDLEEDVNSCAVAGGLADFMVRVSPGTSTSPSIEQLLEANSWLMSRIVSMEECSNSWHCVLPPPLPVSWDFGGGVASTAKNVNDESVRKQEPVEGNSDNHVGFAALLERVRCVENKLFAGMLDSNACSVLGPTGHDPVVGEHCKTEVPFSIVAQVAQLENRIDKMSKYIEEIPGEILGAITPMINEKMVIPAIQAALQHQQANHIGVIEESVGKAVQFQVDLIFELRQEVAVLKNYVSDMDRMLDKDTCGEGVRAAGSIGQPPCTVPSTVHGNDSGIASLGDKMKKLKPFGADPQAFEGEIAIISGLVAKPEHNGKCVIIGKYLKETDRFCVTILPDVAPDGRPRPQMNLKIKSCNLLSDEGEGVDGDSVAEEAALSDYVSGAACSTLCYNDGLGPSCSMTVGRQT